MKRLQSTVITKSVRPMLLATVIGLLSAMVVPLSAYAEVKQASLQTAMEAYEVLTANGTKPGADNARVHILPTQSARANVPPSVLNRTNFYGFDPAKQKIAPGFAPDAGASPAPAVFPPPSLWNPDDLINKGGYCGTYGCNTFGVTTANVTDIFVNCANDSCWGNGVSGNLLTYQSALNASNFINITNQYVGDSATNRYPLDGTSWSYSGITGPVPSGFTNKVLTDAYVQSLVTGVVNTDGSKVGYNQIYHIFLPKGIDVCFDTSYSVCYSPDNSSAFYFCGYHGSFDNGTGHVLYTVEPYDYVTGCVATGMSKEDAQVSILSHETFETITDPDPNNQWFEPPGSSFGEIGDYCAWHIFHFALITGHAYNTQLEYDNHKHACAATL
jgi:hypothetical protein